MLELLFVGGLDHRGKAKDPDSAQTVSAVVPIHNLPSQAGIDYRIVRNSAWLKNRCIITSPTLISSESYYWHVLARSNVTAIAMQPLLSENVTVRLPHAEADSSAGGVAILA